MQKILDHHYGDEKLRECYRRQWESNCITQSVAYKVKIIAVKERYIDSRFQAERLQIKSTIEGSKIMVIWKQAIKKCAW